MNETIQGVTATLEEGFDKIAEAFDIPAEYRDEAKAAISGEVESLVKEANFFSGVMDGAKGTLGGGGFGAGAVLGTAAVGIGGALAADAIKGLASMAVRKVGSAFGAKANRASYDAAFRTALSESEILQNDPQKAKRMADTIFGFAPTVASDANVLANILANSIHGESMDLQTVRAVTELEEKLVKMKGH